LSFFAAILGVRRRREMTSLIPIVVIGLYVAASPDSTSAARVHFSAAERLYDEGRYSEALAEFEVANRLTPNSSTLFDIGRCHEQMGQTSEALRYYLESAHQTSADATTAIVLPAIRNLERRLQDRGVQLLLVRTRPSGGHVAVDGKDLGTAPLAIALPPGRHTVSSVQSGGAAKLEVELPSDRSLEVELAVDAAPPAIHSLQPDENGRLTYRAWVPAAGAGAVLALAGCGLGIAAQTQRNELFSGPHSKNEVDALYSRTTGFATGANVAYGAAGVAAIVAVGLYFLGPRGVPSAKSEASPP
jgi:hypothetical protein